HPTIEYTGSNLVAIVEATEHERRPWQAEFFTAKYLVRDLARRVVGVITVGKISDFLAVKGPRSLRYHRGIPDQVVDIACPHRAGVAQKVDWRSRRTQRENAGPIALRKTFQINGDVDFALSGQFGDIHIGHGAHIDEVLTRRT